MHEVLLSASVVNVLLIPTKSKLKKFVLPQLREFLKHYTNKKVGVNIIKKKKTTLVLFIFSYPSNIFFQRFIVTKITCVQNPFGSQLEKRKKSIHGYIYKSKQCNNVQIHRWVQCAHIWGLVLPKDTHVYPLQNCNKSWYSCYTSSGHTVEKLTAKAHSGAELKKP